MARISVLELMKKNYNVQYEVEKLKRFFLEEPMFIRSNLVGSESFSYSTIFDEFMLSDWKFRQTYTCIEELFKFNNLYMDFTEKYTNGQLIDFIELIDNILHVEPNFEMLSLQYGLDLVNKNYKLMLEVLTTLLQQLGLDEKESPEGWLILIPKNEALDSVVEDLKPAVQWEIISYLKIKSDDLETKRKQLAHLATELYMEKDSKEKGYQPFDIIMNECTLILNNLHIRHNNETGKWENNIIKSINTKDAVEYCDILYNKMLQIVLMRKDLNKQEMVERLSKSLKNA